MSICIKNAWTVLPPLECDDLGENPVLVERDGYIDTKTRILQLVYSGQVLDAHRKLQYRHHYYDPTQEEGDNEYDPTAAKGFDYFDAHELYRTTTERLKKQAAEAQAKLAEVSKPVDKPADKPVDKSAEVSETKAV